MANAADDPIPVRCPHCGSPDAMEHPSADEHESFFCPECRGFKLLRTFRPVFAAAADHRRGHHRSGHRFGRLHRAATGDRWLLPD